MSSRSRKPLPYSDRAAWAPATTSRAVVLLVACVALLLFVEWMWYGGEAAVGAAAAAATQAERQDGAAGPVVSSRDGGAPADAPSPKEPAYVISMSQELFDKARANLAQSGLGDSVRIFNAVRGADLAAFARDPKNVTPRALRSVLVDKRRDTHADLGSMGAIGCFLSHKALWQKVVDENLDGMYIFESDVVCGANALPPLVREFRKEPGGHLLLFGGILLQPRPSLFSPSSALIKVTDRFYLLHAYYITNAGAKIALKNAAPIEDQVDSYLSDLVALGQTQGAGYEPFNAFNVSRPICVQRNTKSSIQTKRVGNAY